ncbi:cytochrome c1 [Asimina triloba]
MKALILVGGFGTRLRPLTLSKPKPLVEFANKAMILHQIEALKEVGVTEVILAINYQPQVMLSFLQEYEKKLGVRIICSVETEPLGTAGPLALAKDKLMELDKPFFVLNSDIICEYPLKEMLEFHRGHGGEASIMVTKVDEPSKFGVVVFDEENRRVMKFVEKPTTFIGNKINAGIYILNTSVLSRIEERPISLEREIFPSIAEDGQLYTMILTGFWMDIGQPKDYLAGQSLYLDYLRRNLSLELAVGSNIIGNVLIDKSAKIGDDCVIGPDVVVGPDCIIESRVRLSSCTLMKGVRVKSSACISGSIIGWHSTIGESAHISGIAVLGENIRVCDTMFLRGVVVLPHKEISQHFVKPEIIA